MKRLLLIIPPLTQLNTAYPSTAFLAGFLRKLKRGDHPLVSDLEVSQADLSLELALRLFSREGLERVKEVVNRPSRKSPSMGFFLENFSSYQDCIESAIAFLQGQDPTLAFRIVGRRYFPEGPRFAQVDQEHDQQDHAKFLASLFIDDIVDVIREGVDARFGFSRYGEKLAASQASFEPLIGALTRGADAPNLIEQMMTEVTREALDQFTPDCVGISVPFPGNVYGAFWIAREAKSRSLPVVMGGGYVNTELRSLTDPRVFDFVDFVTLDDGERPLLGVLEYLNQPESSSRDSCLLRTFVREEGRVVFKSNSALHDIPHQDCGTPRYEGLPLKRYFSMCETQNPMHRLWSDGRWNKLMVAHGCYWKKCNFCDVTLPYISRYDAQVPAKNGDHLVDQMVQLIAETGQSGFHFVDEAAPPVHLKALAERLIARRVQVSWWGNIRFEKTFTPALTELLARSGCIAVTGGLEVASDRLLKVINKGVSVDQVARVTHAFSASGIMVHAYLMYGVPGETMAETVDALERVRQLFAAGCIQSAFWHRFSVTAHSPIGQNAKAFGISLGDPTPGLFAQNDLAFVDLKGLTGAEHDRLGMGLNRALYNFMQGAGLNEDVRMWFEPEYPGSRSVPKAKVPKSWIKNALSS